MTVADETPVLETTTAARLLKERLNLVEEHHSRGAMSDTRQLIPGGL
jgi:hypothetical protein